MKRTCSGSADLVAAVVAVVAVATAAVLAVAIAWEVAGAVCAGAVMELAHATRITDTH